MSFATSLTRTLVPVALTATIAAPVPAAVPAELKAVEASLAATQSLTADFLQTDGRGRQMVGALALKRPGKIRFAYGGGVNMLLVANGKTLSFIDYEVGQKSSWPIAKSPLAVLLSPNPDLARIARIIPSESRNVVVVRARDARRPEFGTLILAFLRHGAAPGGLRLEGWTAIDAQNKKTTVRLSNQRYNVAVPDTAFTYTEPNRKKRSNQKRLSLPTASFMYRNALSPPTGVSPCYPGQRRLPCVTNAWSALAPSPRSKGLLLFVWGTNSKRPSFSYSVRLLPRP